MDAAGAAALIMAVLAVLTAIGGAVAGLWRFAKAQARNTLLQEQSKATVEAKNLEIKELQDDNRELKQEIVSLWALVRQSQQEKW